MKRYELQDLACSWSYKLVEMCHRDRPCDTHLDAEFAYGFAGFIWYILYILKKKQ